MSPLTLRPASRDDASILFAWRNDHETRKNSHVTAPLDFDAHCRWLDAMLSRPDVTIFIAEVDAHAIGTVRAADQVDGSAILSWTVAPEARGRGLAQRMVKQFADTILPQRTLHAEIKVGNDASMRVAAAAGLAFIREEHGTRHYRRPPLAAA